MSTWFLFDLDGTLTDNSEGIIKSARFALDRMGYPNEPDGVLRRFIGPPLHDSFMNFYGFSKEKAFEAVDNYRVRYREKGVYESELFPGLREMLPALREKGAKLCVATSKPLVFTEVILKQHDVYDLFEFIVGANLDGSLTDKTEIIREVLRRIGETGEPVVMVGDRSFDIVGANNCGIQSVGVYYGFADPGELEEAGATYIANTVPELQEILLSLT